MNAFPAARTPLSRRTPAAGPLSRLGMFWLLLAILPAGLTTAAEAWTDSSGTRRIEAEFVALRGETVYLKKANGVLIAVPLVRLDAASQQQARRLAEPAAGAAAPDAAARALLTSLQLGEFDAAWNALPPSYQQDVTDVIRTFGQNMDPEVWNAGTRILKKVVAVLKEKKAFILAQPALQQMENAAAAGENWDQVVGLVDTITSSELMDLQQLKIFDVGAFLSGTGQQIGRQMASLSNTFQQDFDPANLPIPADFPGSEVAALGDLKNATISTVQVQGDAATIRIENNGQTRDLELVRVEGKWLPAEMVQGWAPAIAKIKPALTTAMPEQMKAVKQQLLTSPLSPLKAVEGVLDQLLAAQTQQQFDQVLEAVKQMVGAMLPAGAGGDPAGAPAAGGAEPATDDPFGAPPAGGASSSAADPFGS